MAELRWLDLGRSAAGEGFVRAIAGLTATRLLGVCLGESSVSEEAVADAHRVLGPRCALLFNSSEKLLAIRATSSTNEGDVDAAALSPPTQGADGPDPVADRAMGASCSLPPSPPHTPTTPLLMTSERPLHPGARGWLLATSRETFRL